MSWELTLYQRRIAVLDDVAAQLRAALHRGEFYAYACLLCEQAWVEMTIRDLWREGSERWHRWDSYMRGDVAAADRVAATLRSAA